MVTSVEILRRNRHFPPRSPAVRAAGRLAI